MRALALVLLVAAGCASADGARQQPLFTALNDTPGDYDVRIAEDAPVRRVCVQWFIQAAPDQGREWLWRCMAMDRLREVMFDPKTVEPQK